MTAPFTETTSAWPPGQASEALTLYQEGMRAGTWGAATMSLWFLFLDVLVGHPLSTPHVLGTALFTGGGGLQTPPTHPCRQWSLKPTGFFWVTLPLGRPHFSIYDVTLDSIV